VIRRAEVQDHPWIVATGAEAYRDLGDYTRILPSWLEQPGVLAWIDNDVQGRGRGFAMLGFYTEDAAGVVAATTSGSGSGSGSGTRPGTVPGTPDGGPKHHQVIADLLALAVLPTYQRKGIGTKLLDHVIDVAERVAPASKITQLRLTVAEHNVGAQRLYARNGFHIVEGAATYDRGQRALRMVRALGR
jgi:ribosomal protein S18 acetylase RimI-like enzyme